MSATSVSSEEEEEKAQLPRVCASLRVFASAIRAAAVVWVNGDLRVKKVQCVCVCHANEKKKKRNKAG